MLNGNRVGVYAKQLSCLHVILMFYFTSYKGSFFFQLPFVVQINPEGQSLRTRHNLLEP